MCTYLYTYRVVLVHSHEFVLDKMSAPFPSLATEALKKQGVELKLRARAVRNTETTVYLDSDECIPCDLFIPTNPSGMIYLCMYVLYEYIILFFTM